MTQIKIQCYIWSNVQFVKSGSMRNVKGYQIFILETTKKSGSVLFVNKGIYSYIDSFSDYFWSILCKIWFVVPLSHQTTTIVWRFFISSNNQMPKVFCMRFKSIKLRMPLSRYCTHLPNAWRNERSETFLI